MERPFGPGFKLLLLTGQRRAEVFEMDRGELQGDQWVIPAVRAKNGVASIVPLSKPALKVIEALGEIEGSTLLFPSRSDLKTPASGFSKATARLLKRMAELLEVENVDHFRPHDLRRTMATGMQRLGVAQPVVEAVLNHVSGSRSGVAGIYQRYDYVAEKREALDLWAAEVVRITAKKPSPRQPGQVVTMRRKGRANG
jgi:integrase